jgi:hypothetical protein
MAAANKKKAISAVTSHTRASALVHSCVAGIGVRTPLESVHPNVCQRKDEKLSSQDCTTEPATRRPATGRPFEVGPEAQGTKGELAAQSSRQLGSAEGRLAFATVVAGVASLQKPSGLHKSTANGTAPAEPAASTEGAMRRMYLGDISGQLSGMPDGATTNAQVATTSAALIGER